MIGQIVSLRLRDVCQGYTVATEQCLEWHKLASSYKYVHVHMFGVIYKFSLYRLHHFIALHNKYALYLSLLVKVHGSFDQNTKF